ncbi:hypothetical protein Ddye_020795 [Dipteronia dyeriana]|uniref:RNase H type-1 domain-containing protein n=1 Tax=Dipteronia dyeriana TaxID=168575 RepID=A0AAD9WXD4_9ROSI|nr:hypothetical protein Ddye_020795 [Dipteronia dyeriana]
MRARAPASGDASGGYERDRVINAITQKVKVGYFPITVEAVAILRGLIFAEEFGLLPSVIETDALNVVNMIKHDMLIFADISLEIMDIREHLQYATREANEVAHNLFKMTFIVSKDCYWMETCPPCLKRFVQYELSCLVIALTEELLAIAKQNATSGSDFGTSEKEAEETKKAIKWKIEQATAIDFRSRSLPAKIRINFENPNDLLLVVTGLVAA